MKKEITKVTRKKIKGTRVLQISIKIVVIFTIFLLVSNFVSNYINLMLNRGELIKLMNQLLVKDLKELYMFSMNQYEIYTYNKDYKGALKNIEQNALKDLRGKKSLAMGVKENGEIIFRASKIAIPSILGDENAIQVLREAKKRGTMEGTISFNYGGNNYFGVYKYNPEWKVFLIRAEELNEFYHGSWVIFRNISIIIVIITIICIIIGIFLIRFILRFVGIITSSIMKMQERQRLDLINMSKAPNDDITYLGMAFNALSSTIDNLMTIFRKFVAKDVAMRAYKERNVRLEGTGRDLSILFSDIKGFTFITETLGTDIIKLLNLHYDRSIRYIHQQQGIIGSIIGDALLAVFGAIEPAKDNKSYQAIVSGYLIHEVTASLRQDMHKRKEEIIKQRGNLTAEEDKVYKAVLLEVGVGIDGGTVFYGNIGSYERMTNTVIGDNVNSASRLEGLTRIYKVPVICSRYVKDEVEKDGYDDFFFLEIDQVQVKGKTIGKRIYWPIKREVLPEIEKDIEIFSKALHSYYDGNWVRAYNLFLGCSLPLSEVFRERTKNPECPKNWNAIWTMTTK